MTALTDLISRWDADEGKPYKGKLIDWDAYDGSIGCMCAQGQVLHLVGGWTPEALRDAEQSKADAATAKLLNISTAHAVLLRQVNDTASGAPSVVLTNPEAVLGDQWSRVLDFWHYLDGMAWGQWTSAENATWDAARNAARIVAWKVTEDDVRKAAWNATWDAVWEVAGDAAGDTAWASNEIQGAEILRRGGKPFFFLPKFGFTSPEDIPARPATYGMETQK